MGKSNMIKRADGSYSKHGLWDSIRENKGSGKAPTKEMLKQEKKIKAKYAEGGTTEKSEITEKPKKPLVNWFNRDKEISYTNTTDKNGNIVLDPVTKKPLQKTIKTVTAPDSILSGKGFKKTITNEEELKNIPAQKHNINIPIPTLAPILAGSVVSGLLGTNNGVLAQTNNNLGENAAKGAVALLPFLAGAAGTTKLINKAKADKSFYINADTIGEHLLNDVTGIPYKQKIGSYNTPAIKKVVNTKTVNKESNDTTSKLTPRFLADGGTINNQTMKTNQYGNGGTIHINPENKGKFNATKKATGKTTEELTHSKNPVTKKRAIFAQNAAKWKHAEGGEIDPKNSFGLTGNYSRNPNSEAIESNYRLAADYQRRLGNFNTGLNANLGFNQTMPLNTEVPVMTPMIVPNANVGLNVGYNKNNNNFNGNFNYNPINQGINAEVAYRRRFSEGGKVPINPIIKPSFYPPMNVNPVNTNYVNVNSVNPNPLNYNPYLNSDEIPTPVMQFETVPTINGARNSSNPQHYSQGDENYVLEYAKGGRVLPKYLVGGFNVGLGNKSGNLFTKNYAATPNGFGQTPPTTQSNTTNAPQKTDNNAKTGNNNAVVGAGLGFVGDTTNLLFDNNVFGTRNKVTDSEGNELGEAQSDAGSQTQGALSGALKGASAGAALGPWGMAGGALIGGVAGFLTADTGAEDKLNQVKRERDAQISFKNILGKGPIGNNAIQTNSLALSAYGGYINKKYANGGMKTLNQDHPEATEEVELGESAMLPNGMNVEFGGETHENGGLETNLPEGTRIFSDRIKSGKRTIASIAKPIQNKIEKLKDNNSKAGQNTVKLFENQLDNLFNEQEEIKQIEDMKQQRKYFAKGGLVKYVEGGKKTYRYQPPGAKEMENESDLLELNNIYVKGDANTQVGKDYNVYSDEQLFGNPSVTIPSMDRYTGTYGNTRPIDSNEPRFNKGDIGTAGALGTSLMGNLIQRSNLNKVAPPRTLVAPTFTAGRTPINADYSADLQAADNQFNAAKRGVMLNSGNYSTQAGNLGQLRAEQLRNRSKILQNQNNTNVGLMNEYQKEQAEAANKNAASNYTTDQANMENLYNYNLWKTGQTNAADASAFNTSGQMFNNMVTGQNQLDAAEMYKRMYAQKVKDDLAFKHAMGGYIPSKSEGDENWVLESRTPRNYFAKGGTVYSQKLQEQLNQPTINNAAAMDAEYASYLNKEGQPTQNTFKSKITGLDYKVLPRSEKDLYAANLWNDVHGSAPTKKQVEATKKALDGKKTSSPGANLAKMMSDKFSVSNQEASLVNAVNADREDNMSYLPKKEKASTYKGSELKRQGAQLLDAVGSLGFTAIGNPLYSFTGTDLGFGHTDLSDEAVNKKLKNPYEYTTAAENAMIGIMGGKVLSKIGGYLLPKAGKIINAAARTEELAATKLSDKAFKSSRTKFSNKQAKNWVENGGRQRKLDMESTPEFLNKKRNSILEQEDEAFIQSKNNKMLEQKLKISEGADRYPKRSLEKMNKNLDNQEIPTAKEIENLERYSKNNKKLEDKLNFAENELDNTVIKAKEKNSNMAIKSLETRMKNAKKAGDIDKFNSLKNKYLKLMEMEQ